MIWRLLPYTVAEPAWNMAVDEVLFQGYLQKNTPPVLRFYGWTQPTISLGYFQDAAVELNLSILTKAGYGLVRRPTGGRAVLHDHELTYSVVGGVNSELPSGLIPSYLYISQALVEAFREFGIAAQMHQGVNAGKLKSGACFDAPSWYELMVSGKKLVGSAQYRQSENFLQHGSILLDFIAADLTKVLNLTKMEAVNYAAILQRKVISFAELGVVTTPQKLAIKICESFQKLYGIEFEISGLSLIEQQQVEKLIRYKYSTDNWTLVRGNKASPPRLLGDDSFG